MKKLFGSKPKVVAVTPSAGAYEDLTGAHHQQQQQIHADAFGQQRDPTSPIIADYRHHQRQEQQERTVRKQHGQQQQQQHYRDSGIGYGAHGEDNWEFVHRDDSSGALPNPHPPPVIPTSRTSSLGSLQQQQQQLPPGASPPVPNPLSSPLPDALFVNTASTNAAPPVVALPPHPPPVPVSPPSAMPFTNMLRKKPPPSATAKESLPPAAATAAQNTTNSNSNSNGGMGGGAAAILRALDPRISPSDKARSRKGSADSEGGHGSSNHSNHHLDTSDVERERDSRELEREREWRERDREIRAAEDQRRLQMRDVERERERERERETSKQQAQATVRERDRERERPHLETRETRRKKESSRERSRSREREKEGKEDKKSQWATLFSKEARHDKEREEHEAEQLSRMIGYLTAQPSIDWSLALDICERASSSELNAKHATKSLRREFKYGEPASQLSAARLWAIMSQNCSGDFINHANSKKFVDCLETVITSSRTSPVVRERLIDVLGSVAFKLSVQHRDTKEPGKDTLRWLWRKFKPEGTPDEGVPLASDDTLFSPSVPRPPIRQINSNLPPPENPRPEITNRKQSANGVISYDEDVRRLFQECKIGRGNAQLLSEALAFAAPEDLREKDIIKEFYAKSRASQELIHAQIPWASAGAERSRAQQEKQRAQYNRTSPPPVTMEEKLLAELLKANEDLIEALRIYDDIERIGVEREFEKAVKERSKVETRHAPTYQDEYLEPPGMVSSGSRSPSPSPQLLPSHVLPQTAMPPVSSIQTSNSFGSQTTQQYSQSLAPPTRTVRGPRSPAPPRSRSPSPSRSSTPSSLPGSRRHSRTSSLEGGFDVSRHTALGLAQANGKLSSPLLYESIVEPIVEPPTPIIKISEKAMGKRKLVPPEPDDRLRTFDDDFPNNDNDSLFNSTDFNDSDSPNSGRRPMHYVYDASAERTKEWLKESGSHQSLT